MTSATAAARTRAISPVQRAAALPDDDDEIVYPVSSQSSEASTSPDLAEGMHGNHLNANAKSASRAGERTNNDYSDALTGGRQSNESNQFRVDSFLDHFILERGDAGTRVWAPPQSVQRTRPRGRGHRSTKSEPSIPAVPALRESLMALEPVKESWADDMKGLEAQMARASLNNMSQARPRSTPGTSDSRAPQSPAATPRKQRSQKKQKNVLSRATSAPGTRSNNTNAAVQSSPSPAPSTIPAKPTSSETIVSPNSGSPTRKKSKKGKSKNKPKKDKAPESGPSTAPSTPRGLGMRSVVDDVSEYGDAVLPPQSFAFRQTERDRLLGLAYDEAVKFMNAFIENPDYYTSRASRLTFLQALIVELGLVSAKGPQQALPESLTAAKALLRSHAFLNVKDYLALREKGVDALRSAMRPSRSALVRDLRGRNGRRAKVGWVKETGLSVLLVSCQY